MTRGEPLRVVVVGPPLSASGGIGRVMGYTLAALPSDEVDYRVLDTRGLGSSPWSSILPLFRSCLALLWLAGLRQVDVVHVNMSSHGSAVRKGLVVRVCRLVRLPVVLHLHASSFPEFFDPLPPGFQRWVRATFRLATRVVVLSQSWRSYVEDVLAVPDHKVTVLPNATPAAPLSAGTRTEGAPVHIVFLGRLGRRKGVSELLDALADARLQRRAWRATLAGDGDVDSYRERAAALGLLGRVTLPGWVGAEAVEALLREAHVLVLPSHAEGMPMSVLEAFAAGVPVVCTDVGGLPEVVLDEVNGLLVPAGEATPLADALLRLVDDEDLRSRLGACALDTWRRNHSTADYTRQLEREWREAAFTPLAARS